MCLYSNPALASLLENQKKDQAAQAKKLHKEPKDGNTSGVGSESESENPSKRSGSVRRTLTRVLTGYRRRKNSDAASPDPASRASVESSTQTSPVAVAAPPSIDTAVAQQQTDGPAEDGAINLMSPVAEEGAVSAIDGQNIIHASPKEDNIDLDLGSAPSSPVAPAQPAPLVVPPIAIEESAVLVAAEALEGDHESSHTKMTPVSSAAAGSQFQHGPAATEHEEDDSAEWEQIRASQMQASHISDEGGSFADDDGSSIGDVRARSGPSFLSALKEKKGNRVPGALDEDGASTDAQMGEDSTEPDQRVPATPFITSFMGANTTAAPTEFTPPITPDSEKFPELGRKGSKKGAIGPTKLSTTIEDKVLPCNYPPVPYPPIDSPVTLKATYDTAKEVPVSAISAAASSLPQSGSGSLIADLLPTRDTVDTAAQYAVSFALMTFALLTLTAFVPCVLFTTSSYPYPSPWISTATCSMSFYVMPSSRAQFFLACVYVIARYI